MNRRSRRRTTVLLSYYLATSAARAITLFISVCVAVFYLLHTVLAISQLAQPLLCLYRAFSSSSSSSSLSLIGLHRYLPISYDCLVRTKDSAITDEGIRGPRISSLTSRDSCPALLLLLKQNISITIITIIIIITILYPNLNHRQLFQSTPPHPTPSPNSLRPRAAPPPPRVHLPRLLRRPSSAIIPFP